MPEEIFILSTYLLFGIIGLVAFVIAWELKLIPFLKSKTKQEPGFMGVWRATFADNFSKGEIEYKEHINNKIFYKINTSDYPLALYKYLDWYPISDLPVDNEFDIKIRKNPDGTGGLPRRIFLEEYLKGMIHEIVNSGVYGYDAVREIFSESLQKSRIEEMTYTAMEDKRKAEISSLRSASEGMDIDYAQEQFMKPEEGIEKKKMKEKWDSQGRKIEEDEEHGNGD